MAQVVFSEVMNSSHPVKAASTTMYGINGRKSVSGGLLHGSCKKIRLKWRPDAHTIEEQIIETGLGVPWKYRALTHSLETNSRVVSLRIFTADAEELEREHYQRPISGRRGHS